MDISSTASLDMGPLDYLTSAGAFRLLTPSLETKGAPLTETGWQSFATAQATRLAKLESARRQNPAETAYWQQRHRLAATQAKPVPNPRRGGPMYGVPPGAPPSARAPRATNIPSRREHNIRERRNVMVDLL